jgi:hypothetical protein
MKNWRLLCNLYVKNAVNNPLGLQQCLNARIALKFTIIIAWNNQELVGLDVGSALTAVAKYMIKMMLII